MLWQHRQAEPIGVYTHMEEDSVGLKVRGQLAMKTVRGAEAFELMKMGALNGLSIGYRVRTSADESWDRETGVRTIKKAKLYEVSPVTFPMNDASRISSVKSIEEFESLAEVERHLRDAGGFSRSEATALVSRIKSVIGRGDPGERAATLAELAEALKGCPAV
jgi:HK97 family phage prohead protease